MTPRLHIGFLGSRAQFLLRAPFDSRRDIELYPDLKGLGLYHVLLPGTPLAAWWCRRRNTLGDILMAERNFSGLCALTLTSTPRVSGASPFCSSVCSAHRHTPA
eukprot:559453-Prorocentrum_minimum.AAC.1